MKKPVLIAALSLAMVFAAAAFPYYQDFEENPQPQVIETENYRIHIINDRGRTGGALQPLVRVDEGEKRDMVLARDTDLVQTCKVLYANSLTRHGNPCSALPN